MSSEYALIVEDVGKSYHIYDRPKDRVKQSISNRLSRRLGLENKKYYKEFWALENVHFDLKKGETIGIIGRNGSGKSTLLQIVTGTLSPTTGCVKTNGRIAALLELGSGFNPEFTGRENVYLNASLLGLEDAEIEDRFDDIVSFADIGEFIDQPVKTFSSGMYARLAFAVAINTDPDVLIVDEILAVGDSAFQRKCLKRFYEIKDSGCSILFVSHDQYQVKSVCDRALYLEKGKQRMFGNANSIIDAYCTMLEERDAKQAKRETQIRAEQGSESAVDTDIELDNPSMGLVEDLCIYNIRLTNAEGLPTETIKTGDQLSLSFDFRASGTSTSHDGVSFVFNLYRHDGLYICGTTTLMDGLNPHKIGKNGQVTVVFPSIPLLSGKYKWRVAVNDHGGLCVLADAKDVCYFRVSDSFEAVGMVDLKRVWHIESPA
jgi:lipopolysaccharide transport system ATP-binding protein